MMTRVLSGPKIVLELAKKLQQIETVNRFDDENETEAWRVAFDLSELEETFIAIFGSLVPKLFEAEDPDAARDLLESIGDQLRHAAYHMNQSRYLQMWTIDPPTGD